MPIHVTSTLFSQYVPSEYYIAIAVVLLSLAVTHAFSQGRRTSRERNLHNRTIIVTGGFTSSLGLTVLEALAQRGAQIIAFAPPDSISSVETIVTAIREQTRNELVFAEPVDLASPSSIKSFAKRFIDGEKYSEHRIDGLVLLHEYGHIGGLWSRTSKEQQREDGSQASFLIQTLLLPVLLIAPVERDIRIVNVVNPFYAAAVPTFPQRPPHETMFQKEGYRSLRTIKFTQHLQKVLDALPSSSDEVPDAGTSTTAKVKAQKKKQSNIKAVSVSPGVSRADTVAPYLRSRGPGFSIYGLFLYIVLQPIIRLLTKAPNSAIQSILHVLFVPVSKTAEKPKPRKNDRPSTDDDEQEEEILKPGALYAECAVVPLVIPAEVGGESGEESNADKLGREIWEGFEASLKEWDSEEQKSTVSVTGES
ncbi:hypothetical protein SISNIDRAFT_475847 [Sistotremastrum niveocremeum HHB9708]|uniref:Ketoreductase (KR) domain-containing protein n=1 Tax=Sistotremastrum niveocremeum HHB9708 TaxID=1314777 RepID=A0A164PLS5_9AGAM|nr:hypothetical protein SISNIDRAFT_475847 [Sistotremastrum niveocremeum HHB9708]